jgi:hypothetical protein
MPALDALGQDPCSLLNVQGYPNLWIDNTSLSTAPASDASTFPRIATAGVTKTYASSLTGLTLDAHMITSRGQNASSGYNLLQFLSGGGVASGQGTDYRQLGNIVLRAAAADTPETIIDTYVTGATKGLGITGYTFSTDASPKISATQFWNSADQAADGSIVASPTSLLGRLIRQGYLISRRELYNPAEFQTGAAPPTAGTESLVYLYKINQTSGQQLTTQQTARRATLEAKNLRFFAAFLAEYCFYRTRYDWLLAKYFTIYQQPTVGSGAYSAPGISSAAGSALFSGAGSSLNQYTTGSASITQPDFLKGLVFQMACYNTRLTDLRKLLQAINTYYGQIFTDIQTILNSRTLVGSNADLQSKILALNDSSKKAAKYLSEAEFSKGALEYNSQKNRYGNVLLALYAFLNISAIAVILHISK